MSHIAVYILIYFGNHCGYAFTMNYNEKVLKYRICRVIYALKGKTRVYKFDMYDSRITTQE